MHHTSKNLIDMGKSVCLSLMVNADLDSISSEDPQPLPEGEIFSIIGLQKKNILEELRNNKELLKDNSDDSSSGSESDPSEDNLDPEEITAVYPLNSTPKPKLEEKEQRNKDRARKREGN